MIVCRLSTKKTQSATKIWTTQKRNLIVPRRNTKVRVSQLSLVEEGAQQEDINAAKAQLNQAQASLALAGVTLDTKDWKTQITMAESQVRQAEASLLSTRELVKIRAWEHDIAAAQAQFDQANEQVKPR